MATAPPGYEFIKNPATGKYRLAKIGGVNPLTGGPNDPNSSLSPMGAINPLTGGPSDPNSSRPPIDAPVKPKPTTKPKPGFRWVQSNGSWVQIPVSKPKPRPKPKPRAPKPGGAPGATPAPAATAPLGFVDAEIQRQIAQDAGLTQFVDTQTASIADLMSNQSAQAAAIAAQYNPATPYANATLDANAQQRVGADAALTNQVGNDQSKALAALIAKQGGAGAELMGNMRAASQLQHRDFARHVQGLKPELERRRAEELLQQRLAVSQDKREQAMLKAQIAQMRMQSELARDQFGASLTQNAIDNSYREDALAAETSAASVVDPASVSKYGYGLHSKFDAGIDNLYVNIKDAKVPQVGPDGKPTGKMVPNPNRRWRDVIQQLTGLGVKGGQAVLLASKWMPDRLKIHGDKSPAAIYKILKSGELGFKVSDAVAKQVLRNIGPDAWKQRNRTAVQGPPRPGYAGSSASGSASTTAARPKPASRPLGFS